MKFNIAYPRTGAQKMYDVDDEHKWGKLVDRRMGCEFEGETLGDQFKGYVFKVSGGTDNDGFPMKQGILIKGRVRLILEPESSGFICRKAGAHRRKAVRGCIIGQDMACLSLIIVKKGDAELEGLTDQNRARPLGPKRANKIRKMFVLPRHSENITKRGCTAPTEAPVRKEVDHWDVTRYVIRRETKEVGDKVYFKCPKIQRLVTPYRIRRKRQYREGKVNRAKKGAEAYQVYVNQLKGMKEIRRQRSASGTGRKAPTN